MECVAVPRKCISAVRNFKFEGRYKIGRLIGFHHHRVSTSGEACSVRHTLGRFTRFIHHRDCKSGEACPGLLTLGRLIRFLLHRYCTSEEACSGRYTFGCLIRFFQFRVLIRIVDHASGSCLGALAKHGLFYGSRDTGCLILKAPGH